MPVLSASRPYGSGRPAAVERDLSLVGLIRSSNGATTIWERWDGWTSQKGFQDPGMNSFSHYAFGAVGEWLIGDVAGLGQPTTDAREPNGNSVLIRPEPPEGITWAKATYGSLQGQVSVQWRTEKGKFSLDATIPANLRGYFVLPGRPGGGRDRQRPAGARRRTDSHARRPLSHRHAVEAVNDLPPAPARHRRPRAGAAHALFDPGGTDASGHAMRSRGRRSIHDEGSRIDAFDAQSLGFGTGCLRFAVQVTFFAQYRPLDTVQDTNILGERREHPVSIWPRRSISAKQALKNVPITSSSSQSHFERPGGTLQ